jgi:hypothetical protein
MPVAPTAIPTANIIPITIQNITGSIVIGFFLRFKVEDGLRESDDLAHG